MNSCKKDNETGKVVFWYNTVGTDATVIINGQTGYVTDYYSTYDPDCSSIGCAIFTLDVGTYGFTANSSWSTWEGTVTITKDGCYKVLLSDK
jgi:hypothetical protein